MERYREDSPGEGPEEVHSKLERYREDSPGACLEGVHSKLERYREDSQDSGGVHSKLERYREDYGCTGTPQVSRITKKLFTLLDLCVSSLRRGHANLLCIVPILTDDPRRESEKD